MDITANELSRLIREELTKTDKNDIERMIENRPNMVLEQNNEGKMPIEIIPELIDMLEDSREWEYVKYQEQGIAGVNAQALRGIMEMIKQNGGGV